MKRWIRLAAGFYPRAWREQYGEEFRALLDDLKPGWRVLANVFRGALTMQIAKGTNWLKLAVVMAAAGAIVAAALSFTVPPQYVSSAVIQVTPLPDPLRSASPQAIQERAVGQIAQIGTDTLSRGSLAEIVVTPSLDLYKEERQRLPLEDIVQKMRRDIRIQAVSQSPANGGITPMVFRISFSYPDREKAQAVARVLLTKFVEQNVTINRNRESRYEAFWRDEAKAYHAKPAPPPPVGANLAVIDPPSLPGKAVGPNRVVFLAWGFGAGLLMGLAAALAMRRPRRALLLGGFAAAGCVLACAASFLIPDRYTSIAVMRVTAPQVTEDPLATPTGTPVAERLRQWEPEILSRSNLAKIIQARQLNLYREERAKQPLEKVIQNMRDRDIHIAPLHSALGLPASSEFSVSFSYSDRFIAQAVVRELVVELTELNVRQMRASAPYVSETLRDIDEHRAGENLEVLDPASLPETPTGPNRLIIAAAGLGIGLGLGALTLWLRRPRAPTLQPA